MRKQNEPSGKLLPGGLAILHEDRDIIVVDKPPGLLTISTDREKSRTAYFILTDYVGKSPIGSDGQTEGENPRREYGEVVESLIVR